MPAYVTSRFSISDSEAHLFGYNTPAIPTVTLGLGSISNNRTQRKDTIDTERKLHGLCFHCQQPM